MFFLILTRTYFIVCSQNEFNGFLIYKPVDKVLSFRNFGDSGFRSAEKIERERGRDREVMKIYI